MSASKAGSVESRVEFFDRLDKMSEDCQVLLKEAVDGSAFQVAEHTRLLHGFIELVRDLAHATFPLDITSVNDLSAILTPPEVTS